ncbi:hypothetical protein EWM64_g7762 [Hericium alpestre]|uniref:Major facilitator superfamily (MFS) profile domain-containing protein n=1 Tax=Hericium alpestre TaxID=135208 RepID=A0A4Y9ZPS2_9AGAM|nr:hypothetical protein EWM64_g7762 [Hericium alpestre]
MSLLWVTRAINLLLILPGTPNILTSSYYNANIAFPAAVLTYFAPRVAATAPTSVKLASALSFDRRVAAICFFTDATANALVTLSPTSSQVLFIIFTSLNSLTSGGNPALHSLGAVSLQAMGKGGEVGLVFGALGLVNAVAHIVAPAIYAGIYGATVAVFPKAMFVMSAILLYIAVCMLLGIRPFIHVFADTEAVASEPPSDAESDETEGQGKRGRGLEREDVHEQVRRASIMRVSISEEGS